MPSRISQPRRSALGRTRLVEESDVRRRNLVLDDDRLGRREQMLRLAAEQARTRDRRERHRDLELGIIGPACALERVRPAMVEHIFALAVRLQIGRRGGSQMRSAVLDQERRGRPAGALADASRRFQRGQEGVADERIVACQAGPKPRR